MILVVGATGTLGGRIARELLAQGKAVRVLVRDPSPSAQMAAMGMATSAESLVAAGAERVTGDLTDRASLDAACAGVETVISTATTTKRELDVERVDLNGTLSLIEAASAAGVRHFIYLSAYGAAPGHPVPLFDAKGTCEKALEESGMAWTIVRPHLFTEVWVGMVVGIPLGAGEPVSLIEPATHRHAFISEADVAAFVVAAVDNPDAHGQRLDIGGPAHTWQEVVGMVGEVVGQELPTQMLPMGSDLPLMLPTVTQLANAMETYEVSIDMGDLPARYGVEMTPMPDTLQRMFGAR